MGDLYVSGDTRQNAELSVYNCTRQALCLFTAVSRKMSSRQPRVSLRRKNRISKEDLATEESEFEQLKSPIRKRGTDQTNAVPSPTFRSPVHSVIKSAKLCKTSPSSRETFLDESFGM